MKFCSACESIMSKETTLQGAILFVCRCQETKEGAPADTLMAEGMLESTASEERHQVFIEQSPYDPAGNRVMRNCPQCPLDFLTMIIVGANENTMYTCRCGYVETAKKAVE